jgi:hypothetical protein
MRALSIRQPFAELILRGVKTAEVRSRPTRVIGERFWIYAPKGGGTKAPFGSAQGRLGHGGTEGGTGVWSLDLAVPGGELPGVMLELAEELILADLPRGVIVGSAVISHCTPMVGSAAYQWHLIDVERTPRLRKPQRQPQPVWFRPF